jgi:hypothetical protein
LQRRCEFGQKNLAGIALPASTAASAGDKLLVLLADTRSMFIV